MKKTARNILSIILTASMVLSPVLNVYAEETPAEAPVVVQETAPAEENAVVPEGAVPANEAAAEYSESAPAAEG